MTRFLRLRGASATVFDKLSSGFRLTFDDGRGERG